MKFRLKGPPCRGASCAKPDLRTGDSTCCRMPARRSLTTASHRRPPQGRPFPAQTGQTHETHQTLFLSLTPPPPPPKAVEAARKARVPVPTKVRACPATPALAPALATMLRMVPLSRSCASGEDKFHAEHIAPDPFSRWEKTIPRSGRMRVGSIHRRRPPLNRRYGSRRLHYPTLTLSACASLCSASLKPSPIGRGKTLHRMHRAQPPP